ncbi:Clamp-binding protein CrfC [Nosema granulosis]|uniref:Clamp-binding protein CrfC n=1 Tax=Nosema granulosis TaxID=83296 RepID=A0A9P6GXN9_9MICR|nr:Clamp-binding protein CrfC [Nosema granulosis]
MTTNLNALDTLQCHRRLAQKALDHLRSKTSNTTENLYSAQVKKIIGEVEEEIEKVEQLKLRMTIVASMKSGKSTLINALIGENILPTRSNAMTILPTEVVFSREVQQPILYLSNETIDAMYIIREDVRKIMIETGAKMKINEIFQNEQHLSMLASRIIDNETTYLQDRVQGPLKIQNTLLEINDLIRVYLKVVTRMNMEINESTLQKFRNRLPRIEVPLSIEMMNATGMTNLVIVDTPGPNETDMSKELQHIVTTELRKASFILVIFNYMTLNTEQDAKIMNDITELRKIHGYSDCLYAIVNKVDQRRRGDMTKDDVKKFISAKYGVEEQSPIDAKARRIFETKAAFALTAKKFLLEYERMKLEHTDVIIEHLETVDELGTDLYDFHWERMKQKITVDKLLEGAIDTWKKSGLDELLQAIVSNFGESISSHVTKSALGKCKRVACELIKCVDSYLMALGGQTDNLNSEIAELENEKNCRGKIRSQSGLHLVRILKALEEESTALNNLTSNSIENEISELPKRTGVIRQWSQKPYESGILIGGVATVAYVGIGATAAAVTGGIPLAALAYYHFNSGDTPDSIYFPEDANGKQEFNEKIKDIIYQVCNGILKRLHEHTDACCKELSMILHDSYMANVSDIMKRAQAALNAPLELRQISFKPFSSQIEKSNLKISIGDKVMCSHGNDKRFIPRQALLDSCIKIIKEEIQEIQKALEDWYRENLEGEVEKYINEIEEYLDKYTKIIQRSLYDINVMNADREKLRQNLRLLIDEINKELMKLATMA